MGHERIGFLPHSKQWNGIVEQLSIFDGSEKSVLKIASDTLAAIRKSYEFMHSDESVIKAIAFLATLSISANHEKQSDYLNENGYIVDSNISLFSLMASVQKYITTDNDSLEINKIAKDSALQAVINYQKKYSNEQLSLLSEEPESVWRSAGNGAAFCEMARMFFASFTDRQLKYYIERIAASSIDDYATLQLFTEQLTAQTTAITTHSEEISKIMQSFAAGWFNKHSKSSLPDKENIRGFLKLSFVKLREEFRREAEGK
jgi:hypothetical protein